MGDLNWEYLRVHFDEVVNDINPGNYETKTPIFARNENELQTKGSSLLRGDNPNRPTFEFIGEGYYAYSSKEHIFRRIDKIYNNEIYSAISELNQLSETQWSEFEITKRMNEILVHIEKQQ